MIALAPAPGWPPGGVAVAAAARARIGVAWRHRGRTAAGGLDCAGLVLLALADGLGLPPHEPPPYGRGEIGDAEAVRVGMAARGFRPVGLAALAPGDVLAFAELRRIAHFGIASAYRGRAGVIHAAANRRQVLEEELAGELAAALRQAWRPPAALMAEAA